MWPRERREVLSQASRAPPDRQERRGGRVRRGGRAKVRVPTPTPRTRPPFHTAWVSDPRRCARLVVDVDLSAEPIAGVLRHLNGLDKPFAGWIALIRALELALEAERLRSAPPPSG